MSAPQKCECRAGTRQNANLKADDFNSIAPDAPVKTELRTAVLQSAWATVVILLLALFTGGPV